MDTNTAKKHPLQLVLEQMEAEVRSYSGRRMYGETCLGVSTDDTLSAFVADLVEALLDDGTQRSVGDVDRRDVTWALRRMQCDALGRGSIVYFPGVPFVAG